MLQPQNLDQTTPDDAAVAPKPIGATIEATTLTQDKTSAPGHVYKP